jgi:hypothetical protein
MSWLARVNASHKTSLKVFLSASLSLDQLGAGSFQGMYCPPLTSMICPVT